MKKIFVSLFVLFIMVALFACSNNQDKIIGTWRDNSNIDESNPIGDYTFNEDGTGINGYGYTFKYELKGNILDVEFDDENIPPRVCKIKFSGNDRFTCEFEEPDYAAYTWKMYK